MKQDIRIIGGKLRGKKLNFPDLDTLRPTPNQARETLFNWLMHAIRGARCLDAFAGSGALGIEAYSRGCASVVLLEKDPKACTHLKKSIASLDTEPIKLIQTDALTYLKQSTESFDLIFLDPPFDGPLLEKAIQLIESSSLLTAGGMLYVESRETILLNKETWVPLKSKRQGQVHYALYQKIT